MDVTKILEHDHREVERLFDEIEKAEGEERRALVDELNTSLRAHMALEESVVYPAMEPVTGAEEVAEGNTEHALARDNLDALLDLTPDEPGFGAALEAVKGGITHHVEEEEDEVFPKLRKEGADVLAGMATPFMTKRVELGMPMEADALASAANKDELLAEADSAGVADARSMTKDELAAALAERLSAA
jgi:hemerythrin superfamily protein